MLEILKSIAASLTQVEANTHKIGDGVQIFKTFEEKLCEVLNSVQCKIFKKCYNQALDSKHFVGFLLTPKYYSENTQKVTETEKEHAFEYLKSAYGDASVELTKKIFCLELKAASFTGTLMDNKIMSNFDPLNWWKSILA